MCLSHGLVRETVTDPVTPLFGKITIWYVPVEARVLLLKVMEVLEEVEANVLPSGFNKYVQKEPPPKLGVTCTVAVCPPVPLKLRPIAEVTLIVLVTGVLNVIVSLVV